MAGWPPWRGFRPKPASRSIPSLGICDYLYTPVSLGYCVPRPSLCLQGRREDTWLWHPGICLDTGYVRAGCHSMPNGKKKIMLSGFSLLYWRRSCGTARLCFYFQCQLEGSLTYSGYGNSATAHRTLVKRTCIKVGRTRSGLSWNKVSFCFATVVGLGNLFFSLVSVLPIQQGKGTGDR